MVDAVSKDTTHSALRRTEDVYGQKRFTVKQPLKSIGFDPGEYAKYIGEATRAPALEIEDKIDHNIKVIKALTDLKHTTATLKRSAESLSNYLGINKDVPNLWKMKDATVANSNGQDAQNLLRVTTGQGTPVRNFTMAVSQLAKADSVQSTGNFSSSSTPLNLTGNLVFNVSTTTHNITTVTPYSVTITPTQTLTDIAASVNALTPSTQIYMDLIPLNFSGNPTDNPTENYTFQLMHQNKSVPIDLSTSDTAIVTGLSIPTVPITTTPVVSTLDSLLLKATYNGENITRAGSNFIKNLLPDTTIEVYSTTTTSGPLTATIDFSREIVEKGISGFVDSYNKFRSFLREQTAFDKDKNTPKENAHLYKNSVARTETFDIERVLNTWVQGIAKGAPATMAEIGLSIGKSSATKGNDGKFIFDITLEGDIIPDAKKLEKLIFSDSITQILGVIGNQLTNTNHYTSVYSIPNFTKNGVLAGVPITVTFSQIAGNTSATFSATPPMTVNLAGTYTNGTATGAPSSLFQSVSVVLSQAQITTLGNDGNNVIATTSLANGTPVTVTLSNQGGNITTMFSAIVPGTTTTLAGNYNNGLVTGSVDSIFEGFAVGLSQSQVTALTNGGGNVSTTVTATMGVFAALDKVTADYLAHSSGKFDIELKRLEGENDRLTKKKERIEHSAIKAEESALRDFNRTRSMEEEYRQATEMFDTLIRMMTSDRN